MVKTINVSLEKFRKAKQNCKIFSIDRLLDTATVTVYVCATVC